MRRVLTISLLERFAMRKRVVHASFSLDTLAWFV